MTTLLPTPLILHRQEVHAGPPIAQRHFHTFDALRFFAFFKVFLLHVPLNSPAALTYLRAGGEIGVQFFFVLSGFLITYLIISEKERTGQLNLKRFFARRILRIWPLYYLMVAFAFCTPYILSALKLDYSDHGYTPNFLYTAAFLENYVAIANHQPANVSPLGVMWSVCVEEHFYIVWGIALFFLATRHLPKLILVCVALAPVGRLVFLSLGYRPLDLLTNLDLFALGALPAFLLVKRKETFEALVARLGGGTKVCYLGAVFLIVLVVPHIHEPMLHVILPSFLGLLFIGLLSIFVPATSTFQISDSNIFSRLGKYTYGLYLYHTIVINLLVHIFRRVGLPFSDSLNGMLLLLLALSASIGISMLSYWFFERLFLNLKRYC